MIILRKQRALFVSTPKCATNTIYHLLQEHFGGERLGPHFHRRDVPAEFRDWFVFSVVRNPYSRAVSTWWRTVMDKTAKRIFAHAPGGEDLATFVRWLATKPPEAEYRRLCYSQAEWLAPVKPNRVLRLEHLRDELWSLPWWDVEVVKLPRRNQCHGRKRWWLYLTEDAVRAVEDWAGPDFDTFGYSRKVPHLSWNVAVAGGAT